MLLIFIPISPFYNISWNKTVAMFYLLNLSFNRRDRAFGFIFYIVLGKTLLSKVFSSVFVLLAKTPM
jgi:hypothetical protein